MEENRLDLQKSKTSDIKDIEKNEKDASSAILPCQDGKGQLAKFTWFEYQRSICLHKRLSKLSLSESYSLLSWSRHFSNGSSKTDVN